MHRFRSEARIHAGRAPSSFNAGDSSTGPILPLHKSKTELPHETGGLDTQDALGSPEGSDANAHQGAHGLGNGTVDGGVGTHDRGLETTRDQEKPDAVSSSTPPPAPPPDKSEDAGVGDSAIGSNETAKTKPSITKRMNAGGKRFVIHTKNAIFHSYVNLLLVFVPVGIIAKGVGLSDAIVFALNAIAIIPLASLLTYATESVAARLGDTLGALLNVSFGNAVELIIFIIALVKNEIRIVQASLLGSILSNLLLILGMAFLLGGLRYREQIYNSTVTQMSACLLSLSVMSLLLPTAFHASFSESSADIADSAVLKVSRGTSVILLLVYGLYLLFQLKSHAYMYESTPQEIIDEESHPGVLADIMGSSSSSSDTSSSDSTDSDTSGSGSIVTTGKKIRKKMFRRRRRKSSASGSSANTSSGLPSLVSSPSFNDRPNSYWESQVPGHRLGAIASADEGDADTEGQHNNPRVRDFGKDENASAVAEDSKSAERKARRKKHFKKHHKKHRQLDAEKRAADKSSTADEDKIAPLPSEPRVEFAKDVDIAPSQSQPDSTGNKLAFNMRSAFRPALPKMLSNNVFVQPAPVPEPVRRPAAPVRSKSASNGLRRTNSLPDRLNSPAAAGQVAQHNVVLTRTDPLPPFQHQRSLLRKVTSQETDITEDGEEGPLEMSRTAAVVLLLCSTALVAVCAEFMVDAIPGMLENSPSVGEAFIGLIILPIVSNAAEHVTAVTVAAKNKMDLAIGVAVGSSIQIALFVTPIVVLLGWILDTDMSLYFNLFETVSLFVTAFVVNFLVLDGRSNYLEGSLLIAAYVIIAVGAFFYPSSGNQSSIGGGGQE